MPVGAGVLAPIRPEAGRLLARRALLALAAVALVAAALAILLAFVPAPSAPPRSPFGAGLREAPPTPGGLGGLVLALQASYDRALRAALAALRAGTGSAWPLLALGFVYGVVHAAGPGHGKAVIAGYLVANGRTLARGLALSAAAALVQASGAIVLVGVAVLLLGATAAAMDRAAGLVESAAFAAIALVGAALTWRKAGALARIVSGLPPAGCAPGCEHLPPPDASHSWRESVGVALAAGLRPCTGAILLLVLARAGGLFAAGVAAVLAMALGTALTTGALAALAVYAKRAALHLAAPGGGRGAGIAAAGELLAAAFVLVLGAAMLAGMAEAIGLGRA